MVRVEHGPENLTQYLEHSSHGLLAHAESLGEWIGKAAEAILADKAVDGLRPVRGLLRLVKTYPVKRVNAACERVLAYGNASYGAIKNVLVKNLDAYAPQKTADKKIKFRFERSLGYFLKAFTILFGGIR